jgi:hypothetical protein
MSLCLAVALGVVLAAGDASADDEKWYDKIKIKGDLRLRYEKFDWPGHYDDGNRDRFRYRLRVGAESQLLDYLKVGFELRSGNPDNPHSDNTTFDGGGDKDEISIAQAYAKIKAHDNVKITAGKFSPKKLWHVSDMQWDDDVVMEGLMEEFDWKFDNSVKSLEVNLWQFALEESGSGSDTYLFGGQIAPTFRLNDVNTLKVGAGYDHISHPDGVAKLTRTGKLDTEPEGYLTNLVDPATGELISDFRVASLFAEWKNKSFERWPIKLSAYYYENLGTEDEVGAVYDFNEDEVVATLNADDYNTAWYARLQIGDYKEPFQWAFRASYYQSEADAIFYAFVQSDTKRGSNVDGWRFDARVGMPANAYINFTWYHTDWDEGEDSTMDRWQLDYIWKF